MHSVAAVDVSKEFSVVDAEHFEEAQECQRQSACITEHIHLDPARTSAILVGETTELENVKY